MQHRALPIFTSAYALIGLLLAPAGASAEPVALWLFDEQAGLYPSCVLGDASSHNSPLVLGSGGQIAAGKFGGALEASQQAAIDLPGNNRYSGFERPPKIDPSQKTPPMDWSNANFCALMTRGEPHLRSEVGFVSPTASKLNLGDSDWTVEFWYRPGNNVDQDGVVMEIGTGPRGENDRVTRLLLNADRESFTLINQPAGVRVKIPSDAAALAGTPSDWHHLAFVYESASGQLKHYVDGVLQPLSEKFALKPLEASDEDYLSIGRDAQWQKPLAGRIDELRISDEQVYKNAFQPPHSFSKLYGENYTPPKLQAGPPLLFTKESSAESVVPLGGRKYLFIDDALVQESENLTFNVNPPRRAERVLDNVQGHLVIFDDGGDLVRLYCKGPKDSLAVLTSRDGVHWDKPDLGHSYEGARNVVIEDPVGMGTIFVDPNALPDERIKYFSGYRGRGYYIYTSPDGLHFKRNETSALPFRAASQSIAYYDDQRQTYVAFHRSDMPETAAGKTERAFVRTETTDPMRPWPFKPVSQSEHLAVARERRIGKLLPWYLDNGPLTPPGFGIEYPTAFATMDGFDPPATDIYVPKNVKYAWATDTYLAFPIFYFHYEGQGPRTREILGEESRKLGSGTLETQLAVSRDGLHWKRYPRPPYIKLGRHDGLDIHKVYIAHGMVKRGEELWQYYYGSEDYHSPWKKKGEGGRDAVFRVVQRFDGFVSADTPYTGGQLVTRPLTFTGNRLVLNIDTGAAGYAQVGLLNKEGQPVEGYGLDDCVYINGDFMETEVEWLDKGKDVSALAGQPVQLVFRTRGAKLYTLQFVTR